MSLMDAPYGCMSDSGVREMERVRARVNGAAGKSLLLR